MHNDQPSSSFQKIYTSHQSAACAEAVGKQGWVSRRRWKQGLTSGHALPQANDLLLLQPADILG